MIRDPQRKLAWNDRLFGTMRLALQYGIRPVNMAQGAAAAVAFLLGRKPAIVGEVDEVLRGIWAQSAQEPVATDLVGLTWQAREHCT